MTFTPEFGAATRSLREFPADAPHNSWHFVFTPPTLQVARVVRVVGDGPALWQVGIEFVPLDILRMRGWLYVGPHPLQAELNAEKAALAEARKTIEVANETREGLKALHAARVTELLEANNREVERRRDAEALVKHLAGRLRDAARQFESYASHHRAKGSHPETLAKADTNEAWAAELRRVAEDAVAGLRPKA